MNAIEILMNTLFKALNLDPEKVKGQFEEKVAIYEDNFNLMVNNSIQINQRLERIEKALNIEVPLNGSGIGNSENSNSVARIGDMESAG